MLFQYNCDGFPTQNSWGKSSISDAKMLSLVGMKSKLEPYSPKTIALGHQDLYQNEKDRSLKMYSMQGDLIVEHFLLP